MASPTTTPTKKRKACDEPSSQRLYFVNVGQTENESPITPKRRGKKRRACYECYAQHQRCMPNDNDWQGPCVRCQNKGLNCTMTPSAIQQLKSLHASLLAMDPDAHQALLRELLNDTKVGEEHNSPLSDAVTRPPAAMSQSNSPLSNGTTQPPAVAAAALQTNGPVCNVDLLLLCWQKFLLQQGIPELLREWCPTTIPAAPISAGAAAEPVQHQYGKSVGNSSGIDFSVSTNSESSSSSSVGTAHLDPFPAFSDSAISSGLSAALLDLPECNSEWSTSSAALSSSSPIGGTAHQGPPTLSSNSATTSSELSAPIDLDDLLSKYDDVDLFNNDLFENVGDIFSGHDTMTSWFPLAKLDDGNHNNPNDNPNRHHHGGGGDPDPACASVAFSSSSSTAAATATVSTQQVNNGGAWIDSNDMLGWP
ncbi:uncharacterized protein IWZ02DRAFT_437890 [Phyllosticta citriasiana]|uniref:Zn(2)-C6 fungal-type domain-containing protein n=1 Tax=Phyllosticta citriasiana TaxID=595635 RepID=A0ABR1KCJ3_9PEZI